MSKGSVFARAMGLTKSFSGLTFERDGLGGGAPSGNDGESLDRVEPVALIGADAPASEAGEIAAEAGSVDVETANPGAVADVTAADEVPGGEAMALSAVTIVPEAKPPTLRLVEPAAEEVKDAPVVDVIAADIASLLASLDSTPHDGMAQAPVAAVAANEDEEDQTGALLGELNRLWLAGRSRSSAYMR
jgi:hypothetical protein